MHYESYVKMEELVGRYLHIGDREKINVLDIGSKDVNGSYRKLFSDPVWVYRGLDIEPGKNVDIVTHDHYHWPVDSMQYDVVISGQALEHMEYPWMAVQEVERVLKYGGIAILIAPCLAPLHCFPLDCWRIYPDGMRAMAKFAGLEVLEVGSHAQLDLETWYQLKGGDTWMVCRKPAESTHGI